MSLQSLVKLLMAGIVIAATIPGIIYSQSISPAINATLLAGQVQQYPLRLCRLGMPRHQHSRELAGSHTAYVSKALRKHCLGDVTQLFSMPLRPHCDVPVRNGAIG